MNHTLSSLFQCACSLIVHSAEVKSTLNTFHTRFSYLGVFFMLRFFLGGGAYHCGRM
jgi:hypothetical protein